MTCGDCTNELDHCHGLLLVHDDGTLECLADADCTVDRAAHDWWGSCVEHDGCPCGDLLVAA